MSALRSSASTGSRSSLRSFTGAYPWLRGYALLPWLLPMSVWFAGEAGVSWTGWGPWVLFGVSLTVAYFGHRAVLRWYDRRFGVVWQREGTSPFTLRNAAFSFVFANAVILAFVYFLPPLLVNWLDVPEILFGPRYHWPWVLGSVVLFVSAYFGRPYFSFLAIFGAALFVLALLPLGEWLGLPGGRHLLRWSFGAQGLRLFLVLGYAFASHAMLVRFFRQIQRQFDLQDGRLRSGDGAVEVKERGDSG